VNRLAFLTFLFVVAVSVAYLAAGPTASSVPASPSGKTANGITSFTEDHPDWRLFDEQAVDPSRIRFDHAYHLNPKNVSRNDLEDLVKGLRVEGVPDSQIPIVQAKGGKEWVMDCAACHVPDEAGQSMQPIRFEQHCEFCHQIGSIEGVPIPHGKLAGAMIERVGFNKAVGGPKDTAPPKPGDQASKPPEPKPTARSPRGPRKPASATSAHPGSDGLDLEKTITVGSLVSEIDSQLGKYWKATEGTCFKCHHLPNDKPAVASPSGADSTSPATDEKKPIDPWKNLREIRAKLASIQEPGIPDRWLKRAVFDHAAHRFVSCAGCHARASLIDAAPGSYPDELVKDSPAYLLSWTGNTRDIMIPSIDTCRSCHRPQATRNDCLTCHIYHGKHDDPNRMTPSNRPHTVQRFANPPSDPDPP
jgi:hypothetical protein